MTISKHLRDELSAKFPGADFTRYFVFLESLSLLKKEDKGHGHHILPRTTFPKHIKDPDNLIRLTAGNHLRAHCHLAWCVPDYAPFQYTCVLMTNKKYVVSQVSENELLQWVEVFERGMAALAVANAVRAKDPEYQKMMAARNAAMAADPVWRKNNAEALAKIHANPEGRKKIMEHIERLNADPEHMKKMAEVYADPEWLKNVTAANAAKADDPEWQKSHAAGIAKRSDDPEWLKNVTGANVAKADDPEWQKHHDEAMAALAKDPEWQAKMVEVYADSEWQKHHDEAMAKIGADTNVQAKKSATWARRLHTDRKFREAKTRQARASVRITNCFRWNIRRGKPCTCGHHLQEAVK
jgi:hypothetical protein